MLQEGSSSKRISMVPIPSRFTSSQSGDSVKRIRDKDITSYMSKDTSTGVNGVQSFNSFHGRDKEVNSSTLQFNDKQETKAEKSLTTSTITTGAASTIKLSPESGPGKLLASSVKGIREEDASGSRKVYYEYAAPPSASFLSEGVISGSKSISSSGSSVTEILNSILQNNITAINSESHAEDSSAFDASIKLLSLTNVQVSERLNQDQIELQNHLNGLFLKSPETSDRFFSDTITTINYNADLSVLTCESNTPTVWSNTDETVFMVQIPPSIVSNDQEESDGNSAFSSRVKPSALNMSSLSSSSSSASAKNGKKLKQHVGKLFKLGRNKRWQKRLLCFTGSHLVCYGSRRVPLSMKVNPYSDPYVLNKTHPAILSAFVEFNFNATERQFCRIEETTIVLPKWAIRASDIIDILTLASMKDQASESDSASVSSSSNTKIGNVLKSFVKGRPSSIDRALRNEWTSVRDFVTVGSALGLGELKAIANVTENYCFCLKTRSKEKYVLRAESSEEMAEWLQFLLQNC